MKQTKFSRIISLILVLVMVSAFVLVAPSASAAVPFPSSIYLLQNTNYTCTLCSNAMMLRGRMYLSNNSNWSSITENGMRPYTWIEGAGQRATFSYSIAGCTMNVSQAYVNGLSVSSLQNILNAHPEGIVLYCAGIPHAQWVTDIENGVVYGGDPSCAAYGGRRPIANTYQGQCYGYSQANVLAHATSYWYVSSYNIPANTSYATVSSVAGANQNLPNGTYRIACFGNPKFGVDVSGAGTANNTNVHVWEYANAPQQQFSVNYSNGYYTIAAKHSGKNLDLYKATSNDGTSVMTYENDGTDVQKWTLKDAGNGAYYIVNKANGKYMDVNGGNVANGTNIQIWTGNKSDAQKWLFIPVDAGQKLPDGDYRISLASNLNFSLDVANAGKDNGTNVLLWTNGDVAHQKWTLKHVGNGYYTIAAKHSGKSLNVAGSAWKGYANVQQWTYSDTDPGMRWMLKDAGDGNFYVVNERGLFLDVANGKVENGTNIGGWCGNSSSAQKWRFVAVDGEQSIADGVYTIKSAGNQKFVLDVNNKGMDDGTNVFIWTDLGGSNQQWRVKHLGNGMYSIVALHSGKALDVSGGSAALSANVQQWKEYAATNAAQQWIIRDAGNGQYYIINAKGMFLDVAGGTFADGTNVQTYVGNRSVAQKWVFEKAVVDEEAPVISDIVISEVSGAGYRVTCKVSDNVGVTEVKMPTWTAARDQDDIIWHVATVNNGTATFYVKASDHKGECDTYVTHIYAYDKAGNQTSKAAPATKLPQPIANGTYRIACFADQTLGLDIAGGGKDDKTNVQIWTYDGAPQLKFNVEYVGESYYKITASHTDKAIDVSDTKGEQGANVHQWTYGGWNQQLWKIVKNSDGSYRIVSKLSDNACLDVSGANLKNGTNVQVWTPNDSVAQKWAFVPVVEDKEAPVISDIVVSEVSNTGYRVTCKVSDNVGVTAVKMPTWTNANGQDDIVWHVAEVKDGSATFYVKAADHKNEFGTYTTHIYAYDASNNSSNKGTSVEVPVTNGTYRIACASNTNIGLDIAGGGSNTADGANLELWTYDSGAANQQFKITHVKDGYYKIVAVFSGKALDVNGPSTAPGTNVSQWSDHGGDNQLWKFVKNSDGSYRIVSKLGDNVVMDVNGGNIANGTNIQVWTANDTAAQKFKILPVTAASSSPSGNYTPSRGGSGTITAYGVDVSEWQGSGFNFVALKNAGYKYVILRCGFVSRKDYCFETFYKNAKAAGLDVGVYFYSYATTAAAASQEADICLSYIAGKKFEYPIYFDFEDPSANSRNGNTAKAICDAFLSKIKAKGYLAGLYGYASWLDEDYSGWVPTASICNNKYECWIANYPYASYVDNYTAKYKTRYGMFQYTDGQSSQGLARGYGIDTNMAFKDYPSIVKNNHYNGY